MQLHWSGGAKPGKHKAWFQKKKTYAFCLDKEEIGFGWPDPHVGTAPVTLETYVSAYLFISETQTRTDTNAAYLGAFSII